MKAKSARTIRIDRKRKQILELNKPKATPAPMLVQHVRTKKGKPIGTVVATGFRKVGTAVCNGKDVFRKRVGIQIAKGRAETGTKPLMKTDSPKAWLMAQAVAKMNIRSEHYFGEKKDKPAKRGRPKGSKNKSK